MSAARINGEARKFERAVSAEIRRARERAGISVETVARKAGIGREAARDAESGSRGLRLGIVYLSALAIGLDVEDLLLAARRRLLSEQDPRFASVQRRERE